MVDPEMYWAEPTPSCNPAGLRTVIGKGTLFHSAKPEQGCQWRGSEYEQTVADGSKGTGSRSRRGQILPWPVT
jgi:hypothetical protein